MHLTAIVRYGADLPGVGAMLADEAFVAEKVRASGALSHHVAIVGDADHAFTVTTRRQMPTTGIPAQLRSFVGSTLEVRQVEAWEAQAHGERHGTVVVEITGAPVRLTGTMRLVPEPDGSTTGHLVANLKSSVPLFGSAVEDAAATAMRAALQAEEQAAATWLAR